MRRAREALLAEEIELRRHIERVAEQRRALPPGGEVKKNYRFQGEAGDPSCSLADLFGVHRAESQVTDQTLFLQFGELRERISDEGGGLRRFVNVYVSGEDIRFLDGIDTAVPDGAELTILPAVAGG